MNASEIASFIWSIAELLRGDYKQSEYGKVILPLTVLRRLDAVMAPTKAAVLAEWELMKDSGLPPEHFLLEKSKLSFFNTSKLDFATLLDDAANVGANAIAYVEAFSDNVLEIFEKFEFEKQIQKLDSNNLLFKVIQKFAEVDLHPNHVSNAAMGQMFEELIRKFAELSNETAGEHFTPREVIRLMVNLLFIDDGSGLTDEGVVRTLYDPTAGTGGMLSVGEEHLVAMNPKAKLALFGQELNAESYAICKADMLVKGQDVGNIIWGNTLSEDGHAAKKFDYMLSNPPFGVEWKKVEEVIRKEAKDKGMNGRFGPGLPRVSDGSLLFLLHLVSKMRDPAKGGSRIGIVLNGSPLFTGGAGSGESDIRKYLFENDLVEAIIALPNDMFYNTGIGTYVWVLNNKKNDARKGKVQLVDASAFWVKMRKSLGSKRKELSAQQVKEVTNLYGDFKPASLAIVFDASKKELSRVILSEGQAAPLPPEGGKVEVAPISKIFNNSDFGYTTITVERPLKLRFESNEVSIARLKEASEGGKKAAPKEEVEGLEKVLKALVAKGAIYSRKEAEAAVVEVVKAEGLELSTWMGKTLWSCLEHRDPKGEVQTKSRGKIEPDAELRDTENVPLGEDIKAYFDREVKPHAPDAWIDETKTKVGYEVPFNRHFYVFKPPRDLAEIDADLKAVTANILKMLGGLSA